MLVQAHNLQGRPEQERERRKKQLTSAEWWDRLTLAQKFAASTLTHFGYELAFIRRTENGLLAVLRCGDSLAVIDNEGGIDTEPDIRVRS